MRVLVTYGSKRGGTAGIAGIVAGELSARGFEVVTRPADEVGAVDEFHAVIVGGALYAGRWHKDARRFVERHTEALRGRPTWLFSSGPIGEVATEKPDLPPAPGVKRLLARVGAKGHVTFGGRLVEDPDGLVAKMIARKWAGDWRDEGEIRAWAAQVAQALGAGAAAA